MQIFVLFIALISSNGNESLNTVSGEAWVSKEDCQVELVNYQHSENDNVTLFCADPLLYEKGAL